MKADRSEPDGLDEQVAEALAAPRGAGRQAARRRRRPAARLRALRRARVDAGDARHGPQPRAQRRVGRGPRASRPATSASPGTPTGASCRCSATSAAAIAGRAFEDAIKAAQAGARRQARHRARRRRPQGAHRRRSRTLYQRADRRGVPAGPAGAAAARRSAPCSTPGRASARSTTGASTASPTTGARRSTSSRWCSATRATPRAPASRSAATRSPARRSRRGDFLVNAQGEDVVSGVRNTARHRRAEGRDARGARDS